MKPYPKTPNLFYRDPETYKLNLDKFSQEEFSALRKLPWFGVEKIDGTNIRITIYPGGNIEVRGRRSKSVVPDYLWGRLEQLIIDNIEPNMNQLDAPFTLYGEGIHPKIQSGDYDPDTSFILFDVMTHGMWMDVNQVSMVGYKFGIEVAPLLFIGPLHTIVNRVREGIPSYFGKHEAEGLVVHPPVQLFNSRGERIKAKIKVRDIKPWR